MMTGNAQTEPGSREREIKVVLSGSFRKDPGLLVKEFNELQAIGCDILSPSNVKIVDEVEGFVFMEGERELPPQAIEKRHLNAIQQSDFVWFHAPKQYIGLSGAFEIGFAYANNVPVFSRNYVNDETLRHFIRIVDDPTEACEEVARDSIRVPVALRTMQHYYEQVTKDRGHHKEDPYECLDLLQEEVNELDEALSNIPALGYTNSKDHVEEEIADVFLYIIHMANILDIDLADAAREKEEDNQKRFSGSNND